jgi:hypothetical protein
LIEDNDEYPVHLKIPACKRFIALHHQPLLPLSNLLERGLGWGLIFATQLKRYANSVERLSETT